MVVDEEICMLKKFRSALRREDQEQFDALMAYSKCHVSAGSYSSRLNPFESMVLAMLLEQQKEISRLRKAVAGEGAVVRRVGEGRVAGAVASLAGADASP
jgi:hypothetical protein